MCSMCLTGGRIAHLFCVTVVCGDQQLAANGLNRFSHLLNAVIQRFNRFNRCFHHPGVTNHVAVRVVTNDGVVFTALNRCNQLLGQFSRAHFRLQIVGRNFRRVDQDAVFAFERLFYAAVEEEGHVRIFFSFGNTQLRFFVLRHPLTKGVGQRCWWVSNRSFDVCRVFGQHHKVEVNDFLTGEAVEISVNKRTGDFTRTVSTEVHENQRIAIFHSSICLTFGTDHGGFNEFVVFVAGISSLQTFNRRSELELALRQRHQIVSLFNAIPTVVAVHSVVTTDDGRYAAFAQRGKFLFEFLQ